MDTLGRSHREPKDPFGVIKGTPRELDVLQLIHRLPHITSEYIGHYFGLTYHAKEICAELHAKDYISFNINTDGSYSWNTSSALPQNRGKTTRFLKAHRPNTIPLYPIGGFNKHQRFCMLIAYGLMLGAKENGINFHFTEDILHHRDQPSLDPEVAKNPHSFTTGTNERYLADARLFKLSYGHDYMFFNGFEADMKTESMESEALNSIDNKLLKQGVLLEADVFFKRFGLPSINLPYVTLTPDHRDRILERARKQIRREYWDNIPMTYYPEPLPKFGLPEPSGALLMGDWQTPNGPIDIVSLLTKGGEVVGR